MGNTELKLYKTSEGDYFRGVSTSSTCQDTGLEFKGEIIKEINKILNVTDVRDWSHFTQQKNSSRGGKVDYILVEESDSLYLHIHFNSCNQFEWSEVYSVIGVCSFYSISWELYHPDEIDLTADEVEKIISSNEPFISVT
jgi:hypothetical protein